MGTQSTIDFCPALAALVSPVQNIIFLTAHFFPLLFPSLINLDRQSCWVACLFVFFFFGGGGIMDVRMIAIQKGCLSSSCTLAKITDVITVTCTGVNYLNARFTFLTYNIHDVLVRPRVHQDAVQAVHA